MSSYLEPDKFERELFPVMKDYRVIEFIRNFMPGLHDTYGLKIIGVSDIFTMVRTVAGKAVSLKVEHGDNVENYWIYTSSYNLIIELVETATKMPIVEFTYGMLNYKDELKLVSPGVLLNL